MELPSRRTWQASRWGQMRDPGEASHRDGLSELLGKNRPVAASAS
jgi:hypothetical protein